MLGYYIRNNKDTENLIKEIKSIASEPTANYFFNVSEEAALSNIAGTLGDRIFNIEGLTPISRDVGVTRQNQQQHGVTCPQTAVPIRYGEARRQLQNGDVAGGIQRPLLQPTGREPRPVRFHGPRDSLSHTLGTADACAAA